MTGVQTCALPISKYRFPVPIIAFSTDQRTLRQMSINFGVVPHEMETPEDMPGLIARVDHFVKEKQLAVDGDRIVLVAGSAMGTPGTMNGIVIHTVGRLAEMTELRQIGELEST